MNNKFTAVTFKIERKNKITAVTTQLQMAKNANIKVFAYIYTYFL